MMLYFVARMGSAGGGDLADSEVGVEEWGKGVGVVVVREEKGKEKRKEKGEGEEEGETVETGTGKVPTFPVRVRIPREVLGENGDGRDGGEYVLLGWGIRTVSFLKVQVGWLRPPPPPPPHSPPHTQFPHFIHSIQ